MNRERNDKPRRSPGSTLLMVLIVLGGAAMVVWANLWKENLRLADISVAGNSIVEDKEILSLANINKGDRLFSVDLLAVQRRVLQNAFIQSVSVNREAPDHIAVTVRERVPLAAVVLDKLEYLDAEGIVLPPSRSPNIFDLPVITGSFQQGEFVPGKRVQQGGVSEALEILAAARQIGDELYRRISEVHLESGKGIVLFTAESGVPVLIGHSDFAVKLLKFDGFWKEIVSHRGPDELVYVDLRFDDQVVVRWNNTTPGKRATTVRMQEAADSRKS